MRERGLISSAWVCFGVGGGYLASKDRDWDLELSGFVCPSFPSKLSHGSSVESEVIAHFGENYFPKIDF